MTIHQLPPVDRLRELFNYDPEEGLLTWKVARANRCKPGDEAGTVGPDGYVRVTVDGHRMMAQDICAALHTGQWHADHLYVFLRGNRDDLRINNMQLELRNFRSSSSDEKAVRNREYVRQWRIKQKERQRLIAEKAGHFKSAVNGVSYSDDTKRWSAYLMPNSALHIQHQYELGKDFRKREDAEKAVFDAVAGFKFVKANPCPQPSSAAEADLWRTVRAGHKDITLLQAHQLWAYDPATGVVYWRMPPRTGLRADEPSASGTTRSVQYLGKRYPAHYIGWFLTHGDWMRRRGLRWRDGNKSNNAISNLERTILA